MHKFHFIGAASVICLVSFSHASYAQGFIHIPCPDYKRGDVINYKSNVNNESSNLQLIVNSIQKNMFVISSVNVIHGQNINSKTTYSKKGNNLYLVKTETNTNGMKTINTIIPPEPICGKIPSKYSYLTTVSNNMGGAPSMKTTVTLRKIGDKQIKLPLGDVKTIVVQKTTSQIMDAPIPNPSFKFSNATTTYHANKYGSVKTVATFKIMVPDMSSMMKGANYDNVFEGGVTSENMDSKLRQLQGQPQSKVQMKYKEQKTITTSDLISYRRGK